VAASGETGERRCGVRILVVDNYDSFVFNLVQYLGQLDAECLVRRNDEVDPAQVAELGVSGVLLSPGPGTPEAAGVTIPMVTAAASVGLPVFGVCLGHQAIGVAFGATVDRAPELLHGKTSVVHHGGDGVLADLPNPFVATRYHSLAVEESTLPPEIEVTARTESGVVMAMRHRTLPIEGVQFHPESVLTQGGHLMLARWLEACGDGGAARRLAPALATEVETLREAAFA
jgi:para-aminobenzoate synthetase component 2